MRKEKETGGGRASVVVIAWIEREGGWVTLFIQGIHLVSAGLMLAFDEVHMGKEFQIPNLVGLTFWKSVPKRGEC